MGLSLWSFLGDTIRPWWEPLLCYLLVFIAVFPFSLKGRVEALGYRNAVFKKFFMRFIGCQMAAGGMIVLYTGFSLGWKIIPSAVVAQDFAGIFWHFLVIASFVELALMATVLLSLFDRSQDRLGEYLRLPKENILLLLVLVFVVYLFVRFLVEPLSLLLFRWAAEIFVSGHGKLEPIQSFIDVRGWIFQSMMAQVGFTGKALIVIWLGLVVPVVEESFFRGVFLSLLNKRFSISVSISIQALLFSLVHLDSLKFLYLFIIGLIAGILTKRYFSILPAVLLHCFINFSAIIVAISS